jgi:hypothetical protein
LGVVLVQRGEVIARVGKLKIVNRLYFYLARKAYKAIAKPMQPAAPLTESVLFHTEDGRSFDA